MATMEFENAAPEYWGKENGAHWILKSKTGIDCCALRSERTAKWFVVDCYCNQDHLPAQWDDKRIKEWLIDLMESALKNELLALAQFKRENS